MKPEFMTHKIVNSLKCLDTIMLMFSKIECTVWEQKLRIQVGEPPEYPSYSEQGRLGEDYVELTTSKEIES